MGGNFADDLIAHLPALRRYALALTGRAAEADDLVQDCIERALGGERSLRDHARLGAWLRSILYRLVLDRSRARRREPGFVAIAAMEDDLALSVAPQDPASARDFLRALMTLGLEQRQILLLVGVEGLSYRQIAAELQVPIGTVMSRLSRARAQLSAALAEPASATVVPLPRPQARKA